jgi:hypothetical protein
MRIPLNFFGISFGLAGLSEAWNAARPLLGTPRRQLRLAAVWM